MSASFAYEDPLLRAQTQAGMNTTQKAGQIFREMGRGMWTSGKGFGKVGALFAGIECVIEGVRLISFCVLRFASPQRDFSIVPKMTFTTLLRPDLSLEAFLHGIQDPRPLLEVAWLLQLSLRLLICFSYGGKHLSKC